MFRTSKKVVGLSILAFDLTIGAAHATTLGVNCSTVSGPTELAAANISCGQFNPAICQTISWRVAAGAVQVTRLRTGPAAAVGFLYILTWEL